MIPKIQQHAWGKELSGKYEKDFQDVGLRKGKIMFLEKKRDYKVTINFH